MSVIIKQDDSESPDEVARVLIGRRGPACARGAGLWAFPGGHVDEGETALAAARREVEAETGLWSISICPSLGEATIAVTDHLDNKVNVVDHVTIWVLALLLDGEPVVREPTKCLKWRWVTLKELLAIRGAANPNHPQYEWLPASLLRQQLPRHL